MDERQDAPAASSPPTERGTRLDSWKEIAAYLNRDLRTLQRWEKTANLPIRRLNKPGMRAVFAYTGDLDEWLRRQSPDPAGTSPEIVKYLREAMVKTLAAPEVSERIRSTGQEPIGSPTADFQVFFKSEVERFARVIEAAKIPKLD